MLVAAMYRWITFSLALFLTRTIETLALPTKATAAAAVVDRSGEILWYTELREFW